MKKAKTDRHLDIPAEANRDKHINYTALENLDTDPANDKRRGKLNDSKEDKKGDRKKKEK